MNIESAYSEFARANEISEADRAAYYEGILDRFLKNFPDTVLEPSAPFECSGTKFDLVRRFTVQDCAFFLACEQSRKRVAFFFQKPAMAKPWYVTVSYWERTDSKEMLRMIHEVLTRPD